MSHPQDNSANKNKTSAPDTAGDQRRPEEANKEVKQYLDDSEESAQTPPETAAREDSALEKEVNEQELGTQNSKGDGKSPKVSLPEIEDEQRQKEKPPFESSPDPAIKMPHQGASNTGVEHEQAHVRMVAPSNPILDARADKRIRKNALSRVRNANYKQKVMELKQKPENELTEQEKATLAEFENRRRKKNLRSKERAMEKKTEVARILAKSVRKRTKEENNFVEAALEAKQKKNMKDKIRRKRIKASNTPALGQGQHALGYPSYFNGAQVGPPLPSVPIHTRSQNTPTVGAALRTFPPFPHPPPAVSTQSQQSKPGEGRGLSYLQTGSAKCLQYPTGAGMGLMSPGHNLPAYFPTPYGLTSSLYVGGIQHASSMGVPIPNDKHIKSSTHTVASNQNSVSEKNIRSGVPSVSKPLAADENSRTTQLPSTGCDTQSSVTNGSTVATEATATKEQNDGSGGAKSETSPPPSNDTADSQSMNERDYAEV